ncbi:MAG: hypothetical protein K6A42_04540, partial [Treponema sp.]|nr:hypothetical protein [Treponema sp.]
LNGVAWTYWYGELLAMTCEDMMQNYFGVLDTITDKNTANNIGSSPKGRLSRGNEIASFNGLTGESSATYAAAFKFSAWLTRNFGGVKFVKEMAQNAYVDMDSILIAVNTVNGTNYTAESLLQKFAGDQLEEASGAGMNKNAPTYPGQSAYTCSYTDSSGNTQTYLYPFTAINLWEPFYGWCNTSTSLSKTYIANSSIPFTDLPTANIYRDNDWQGNTPTIAYKGPLMFNSGSLLAGIGPYESNITKLGTASDDIVTLTFGCAGTSFRDLVTIWVR